MNFKNFATKNHSVRILLTCRVDVFVVIVLRYVYSALLLYSNKVEACTDTNLKNETLNLQGKFGPLYNDVQCVAYYHVVN